MLGRERKTVQKNKGDFIGFIVGKNCFYVEEGG